MERKSSLSKKTVYISIGLITFILFWFSKDTGIFWDNVIFAGKMGNHLFENGLFSWNFPNRFDPGHPPFLAFTLASGWMIFGKSLLVSHTMLIPFVFGLLLQIYRLCEFYFQKSKIRILVFFLILVEPTLSTQFILISPEVIQLFFFFLAINALIRNQTFLKIIALGFLGIVSFRGMLLCSGIFIFEIGNLIISKNVNYKSNLKKIAIQYLLGAIPALLFIAGRLYFKGWISSHPDSPWVEYGQTVDIQGFFRNIVVLAHRYLDFGKVFIFLILTYGMFNFKILKNKANKQLLLLSVLSCIGIILISLKNNNPFGHRYFIASYTALILLVCNMIFNQKWKHKYVFYSILFLGLITGNFWIYPKDIAQGWDASLAHIPYHNLRRQAITYLDNENISLDSVTTFSPNANKLDNIDLNDDEREILPFNNSKFAMYSNVYNLNDEELDQIDSNYELIQRFSKNRIYVDILQHK